MKAFVPIKEVAETLGVSVNHIRKLLWKGALPASTYIKVGKAYRFDLEALIDFFRDESHPDEGDAVADDDVYELNLEPDEATPIPADGFDMDVDDDTPNEPLDALDGFGDFDNDEDY